jgi:4-amino-4-deoxy-L-arabinose transferase-like glycosyltransferase
LTPRRVFIAALVAWAILVGLGLVLGGPLTPDESAYALLARGVDVDWLYRPRGVVLLAHVGVALGGSEPALRLVMALASFGLPCGVAAVGRRAFGPWVGAWSAAIVVGAHAFVLRAPELLGDVPAASCLLAATALLVGELSRDGGPRYRLVATAPLLAAAFYLRYGSAPMLALVSVAALATWPRAAWSRPGPVLATAAALLVLLSPFALVSLQTTGSITGILVLSREVASREPLGAGLRAFVLGNPFASYGALMPPVLCAGLASLIRPPRAHRRTAWFLGAVAIGQIVSIGLVGHGDTRYIFYALGLLVILGVDRIGRLTTSRWLALPVAAAALVLAIVQPIIQARATASLAALIADTTAIRTDAAGQPCAVAALAVPQVMWYSGCAGVKLAAPGTPVDLPPDRRWYTASTPGRPVDPAVVARAQGADPIALPSPSAWYLRPR